MSDTTAVRQKSSSQQRIIAAARQLFAERGFHQTAMADLAKEANVSVGAIYRSFASKADIILDIILIDSREELAELQADADSVRKGDVPVETAIEHIILRCLSYKEEGLTHEILAEAHRNPLVASSISDFYVSYRDIFSELARLARPSLAGDELEGVVELLLACLFGLGNRSVTRPRMDEATTAKVTTRLILQALGVTQTK